MIESISGGFTPVSGEAEVPLSTDSQAESGTLSVQPVNKVEAHIFLPISRPPSSENWLIAITVIFSKKHLFKIIKGNDGQIGERLARGGKSLSKTKQRSPLFKTIKGQNGQIGERRVRGGDPL